MALTCSCPVLGTQQVMIVEQLVELIQVLIVFGPRAELVSDFWKHIGAIVLAAHFSFAFSTDHSHCGCRRTLVRRLAATFDLVELDWSMLRLIFFIHFAVLVLLLLI